MAAVRNLVSGLAVLLLLASTAASADAPAPCKGTRSWFEGRCRYPDEIAALKREAAAAKAKTKKRFDRIEWVRLDGGAFTMGDPDGRLDQKPTREVTVAPFEVSRSEVTFGQYDRCVAAGGCTPPSDRCWVLNAAGKFGWGLLSSEFRTPDRPVVCVTWQQAATFAAWVGGRLVSEAEWEYLARGGGKPQRYPWGDAGLSCERAVIDDDGKGCCKDRTWPACSLRQGASPQKVCDLIGNVYELVADAWHPSYEGAPTDGSAWGEAGTGEGVLRGCAWAAPTYECTAMDRQRGDATFVSSSIGFRVARGLAP